MEDFFIKLMSIGSLVISVIIISFVFSLLFKKHGFYASFLKQNGLFLVFIFSVISTVGSLVMSLVWELPPCDLCWYQRMFMYPIAVISAFALYKKDYKNGSLYSLLLAAIGSTIAAYHYLIQISDLLKKNIEFCSPTSVDCSIPDFVQFGFVTTPFISLTVFILIIISAIYATKRS